MAKKIGFARLSKADRSKVARKGGLTAAKLARKGAKKAPVKKVAKKGKK